MNSDIYSKPEFLTKVRHRKTDQEDTAVWEVEEEDISDNADDAGDDTDFPSQRRGQQTQKRWSLQKGPVSGATLCLGVLSITLLAAVIILSIHFTLEKNLMQTKLSELSAKTANISQQQEEVKQLKDEIEAKTGNMSQQQEEMKKLKDKIEVLQCQGKWCPNGWRTFGCSCYNKFTEKKTWYESRRDCQERGADLVIINSKEEQEFIRELNMNRDSWIGLKHEWSYGWKWVDESPLTTTFWAAGWPKNDYYASCCSDGKWTDSYSNKNWICEK